MSPDTVRECSRKRSVATAPVGEREHAGIGRYEWCPGCYRLTYSQAERETCPERERETGTDSTAVVAADSRGAGGGRGGLVVVGRAQRPAGCAGGRVAGDTAARHGALESALGRGRAYFPLHVPRGIPGRLAIFPRRLRVRTSRRRDAAGSLYGELRRRRVPRPRAGAGTLGGSGAEDEPRDGGAGGGGRALDVHHSAHHVAAHGRKAGGPHRPGAGRGPRPLRREGLARRSRPLPSGAADPRRGERRGPQTP